MKLGESQNRCARIEEENNLALTGPRTPIVRPTSRSQSLYQLRYGGSFNETAEIIKQTREDMSFCAVRIR
jgi:hypothetical protein